MVLPTCTTTWWRHKTKRCTVTLWSTRSSSVKTTQSKLCLNWLYLSSRWSSQLSIIGMCCRVATRKVGKFGSHCSPSYLSSSSYSMSQFSSQSKVKITSLACTTTCKLRASAWIRTVCSLGFWHPKNTLIPILARLSLFLLLVQACLSSS